MKNQDNKDKLKESFSIFQKPKAEKQEEIENENSTTGVGEEVKGQDNTDTKLKKLFSGEENKGYSAVQVKRYYLDKIEELAKEHKTTKTRVVNIIIEEFLKIHDLI